MKGADCKSAPATANFLVYLKERVLSKRYLTGKFVPVKLFYLPDMLPIKTHYHYSHPLKKSYGYTYQLLPLYHDKITFNVSNIENILDNTSRISGQIGKTAKENPTYDLKR